jgi:hypothetical protein
MSNNRLRVSLIAKRKIDHTVRTLYLNDIRALIAIVCVLKIALRVVIRALNAIICVFKIALRFRKSRTTVIISYIKSLYALLKMNYAMIA